MLPEDAPFIRRLPLFRNMTSANFATLTEFATMQRVPTGHLLVEQGAAADHLFIVVEGAVELFATWGGATAPWVWSGRWAPSSWPPASRMLLT